MTNSIFIVDDEEGIQLALKEVLELEGFSVATATTGSQALESLKADSDYSLILLDFRLPDMSGPELVEKIREKFPLHAPIVLLSAIAGLKQMSLPQGVVAAICKPFDIDLLIKAVQQYRRKEKGISGADEQKLSEVS